MTRKSKMSVRNSFSFCLLVVTALETGCASQGKYASFQPLPRGSTISVVALEPEIAVPDAKTAGETVGKAAAGGAGGGMLGGLGAGITVSAMCGPAIAVCAFFLVPAGAAIGLVGGTALGAASAGLTALPKEKAEALEEVMSNALQEIDFADALQSTFIDRSGDRWNLSGDAQAVKVTLGIEALNLTQLEDDVLVLNITTSMTLQYGLGEGETTRRLLFSHSSIGRPVDDFLIGDGEHFRSEITTGLAKTVEEMVNALDYVGSRKSAR